MTDSLGFPCPSCFTYTQFNYDASNRLESLIENSYWNIGKDVYYFKYDALNRLVKIIIDSDKIGLQAKHDSLVYNNLDQITQVWLFNQYFNNYFIANQFTYDSNAKLVVDSVYEGPQYTSNPGKIFCYYKFTYDGNNNIIMKEKYNPNIPYNGTFVKDGSEIRVYDDKPNQLKFLGNIGFFDFFTFQIGLGEFACTNNLIQTSTDFNICDYYSNGLIKTKTKNGGSIVQRFVYE